MLLVHSGADAGLEEGYNQMEFDEWTLNRVLYVIGSVYMLLCR